MYEKFYGFKENPFTITPDPKFFFPSPKHTEVLDSLIYTVTERRGFAVITGEIGSGKTTICRTLLERLSPGTKVAMITNTYLSPKELLSYTLEEFGVTFDGREKSNLLSCLRKFLVEQLYLDFNVVLIIDEAQNLSLNVLEEIRMLSNLETEKKKMIQIILTGQPALKDKLASKELDQLRQRINVQYHIPPLNRINNERYINHRLEVASINGNRKVEFTPEAIDKIYAHSQGIPRVINMVCNNALLIGYVTEAAQITPEIIKEAIEIQFNQENPELKTTETQLKQKNSELKETETQLKQLNEQLNSNQEKLATTQSQLQEAGIKLTQLNEQLNQLKKNKEEAQLQQAKLEQLWLERQTQWQTKEEEASKQLQATQEVLSNCESIFQEKILELKDLTYELQTKQSAQEELNHNITQLKEELKNLQEQKHRSQQEQETLLIRLKSTQDQLKECQSELTQKQSELTQTNQQLQSSQETLNATQSLVNQKKAELDEQNQKLATKESQLQATETQLKQLNEQFNSNQEKLVTTQSQLQEAGTQLTQLNEQLNQLQKNKEGASKQLQAIESKLSQLNEELKKAQEENSQLKLKQEAVSSQLKGSLNLYESTIAEKQVELDRINKNLQSSQRALNDTESKCHQKYSELEQVNFQLDDTDKKLRYLKELILEQTRESTKKIETKGLQLKEIEDNINQLNKELDQVRQEKQKLQAEEERLRQIHLERKKEWEKREEEFNLCESAITQKQSALKELNHHITQLKEELKNLQEEKIRYQQAEDKLNQVWSDHQLQWHQKEKEILEQLKFAPLNKGTESKTPRQPESKRTVDLSDNPEKASYLLEKSAIDSNKKPIIKLKAKHPKAEAAVLTASASGGEIKIDPLGNDDSLSSVYSGIRIFHRNGDIGNYKNFIFSAKGDKKKDYSTVFRVELNNNGAMKVGKHHSVRVIDSWQKFNIPLEDFSRMINLNLISEIAIFLDAITEADDITYIKDICFSNI
jgi:general secretion pathway protein A